MDAEQASGRPAYLWWLLPGLVFVIGVATTALMAYRSQVPVTELASELTRAHHERLTQALIYHNGDTLAAAAELPVADELGFNREAREFLARYPDVAGVEKLVEVDHAQRDRVERDLTRQTGQLTRFGEWNGQRDAAGPQEDYLVIQQAIFLNNENAALSSLGLVATSVPHWRSALRKALQDHQQAATPTTGLNRNGHQLSAMRVFLPQPGPEANNSVRLLAVVIEPDYWVRSKLASLHDQRWQIELHDISQYALRPFAVLPASGPLARGIPATRSTVTIADRQWMLSAFPSADWLDSLRQQALWPAWLTGLLVTLMATGLALWAGLKTQAMNLVLDQRTRRTRRLGQQLDNTRVEKSILHHSLQESDHRTRDLIELGAGIFAELDESRDIGYISPQVADFLEYPSHDLIGQPLANLVPAEYHGELVRAFDSARRDRSLQRLDTYLITANSDTLAVALRIKALKDPLSGCSGYRVTMTPRQ